jgi:predicted permease
MPDWKEDIRERLAPTTLDPVSEIHLVEELAQHLDDRYHELLASGVPSNECRRRVLAELDVCDLVATGACLARRAPSPRPPLGVPAFKGGYMRGLLGDLKIALRNLKTQPWFSVMVTGMLGLGIAGNVAMFSIFNGLFLHPLPFGESERLIELDETAPKWNLRYVGVSNPDFYAWCEHNSTFDGMAFFSSMNHNLSVNGTAQRVEGVQVTRDMLGVLRLKPILGRDFRMEEDKPGGAKVLLLSYDFWQRVFQADRNVLGQVVKLDELPYTVIGVLPRETVFPNRADLWTPVAADTNSPSGYYLNGVGRLKPGVSIEQAQADLLRVHKAMISEGRKVNEITSPILTPLRDRYLGDFKIVSRVLLAAVGVVLLVVCMNVAALVMVRGGARSREIAIRTAMGASRGRIAAQLLTENAVLATAGSLVGVPLGAACLRAMVSRMPEEIPQWISFSLDWRFAIFCVAVTGAAALLFGLAPVLLASRIDIRGALQNAAARTTATRGRRAMLGLFVVCEISLALMLSISAGLLVQAFRKVLSVNPGFRPENVLTFGISLPDLRYDKPEKKIAYYESLLGRLRELPGVRAAGATSAPPLGGHWGGQFEAEGGHIDARGENPVVLRVGAMPGYFDAIGTTLLAGRAFEQRDCLPNSPLVAVVNEVFAKHFWPAENPIGKRIRYPGGRDWYQVIGLLRDARQDGLDQDVKASVFLPHPTTLFKADRNDYRSLRLMTIVLRGSGDPNTLVGPAREIVRRLDAGVPIYAVQTMTERLDRSLWARRAYSWLFGAFAGIAVLLAAAGVYSMVSYAVSQRTQEIGIRVALGAQPTQVLRQVMLGGMTLVSIGVGVGLLGAFWATALLGKLLFGISSRDPFTYVSVVIGLIGVGLLANFVPARRAAAVDPMRALHFE